MFELASVVVSGGNGMDSMACRLCMSGLYRGTPCAQRASHDFRTTYALLCELPFHSPPMIFFS